MTSGLTPAMVYAESAAPQSDIAAPVADGLAKVLQAIATHSPDILAAQASRSQAQAQVEQPAQPGLARSMPMH